MVLPMNYFGKKPDGIRLIWEYIKVMIFQCGGVDFMNASPKDLDSIKRLSDFYCVDMETSRFPYDF